MLLHSEVSIYVKSEPLSKELSNLSSIQFKGRLISFLKRRFRLAFWIQSFSFGYSRPMPPVSSRSWTRSPVSMSRNRIVKVVVIGLFGVNNVNALSPHELRSRSNHRLTDHLRLLIGTGVSSGICVEWSKVLCAGVAMVHGTYVYCYGNTT